MRSQASSSTFTIASSTATSASISTGIAPAQSGGPSATQASTATAAADTNDESVNTTALDAGLGVGIPALAALVVSAFFLWRRKKRNAANAPENPTEMGHEHFQPQTKYTHYTDSELHGAMTVSELAADLPKPVELAVSGRPPVAVKSNETLM
ncbi:hypothetical protein NX059_005423 [Plenodomus lindquistii]|nr:hypothetical protein NX059_005423 [Plenodomus lindquistii]